MSICFVVLLAKSLCCQDFVIYRGDTINRVINGMKEGKWIIFLDNTDLSDTSALVPQSEGVYKNGRKNGVWTAYFPDGKKSSEVTFVNNRPSGPYTNWYASGGIMEEGEWRNGKNTNGFARYYEDGTVMQRFRFDAAGRRQGKQTWFHPNGKPELEANFLDGKEQGTVTRYWPDGTLHSTLIYNNGQPDMTTLEKHDAPVDLELPDPTDFNDASNAAAPEPTPDKTPNKGIGFMKCNGDNILYDKNKLLWQKGTFKNCKLWNGKMYIRKDGVLIRIEVYKHGRHVGEAPITPEDA